MQDNNIHIEEIISRLKKVIIDYPQFNLNKKLDLINLKIIKYTELNKKLLSLYERCCIEEKKLNITIDKLENKKRILLHKIGR